jgi:acyl transferase domain-containing protein
LLTLSARTAGQARELALRVAGWLGEHPEAAPGDVCATTRVGRRGHSYRLHAVGATIGELREGLVRAADGEVAAAPLEAPKVAFLFTGQGSQGIDMGRRLAAVEPVFRAALDEVDALASRMIGRSIVALMHPAEAERAEATRLLGQTRYAQPAIFAIGVALYRLWRSWGVTPAAVMGHSLGEYVAAYAAGALTLQGALGLVVRRAELMQALPAGGVMVSLGCAAEQVPLRGTVAIAAINAPDRTVIAGAADEVESVARAVAARGVEVRRLEVSHAFHSSLIEPMLAEFAAFAADVPWRAPEVPLVANVSGVVEHGVRGADEWRRHAREPVRFADGVRTLVGLGVRVFVELGARPMLSALGQRCVDAEAATWVASLRGDVADERVVREGLGELERLGVGIDWEAVEAGRRFRRVHLPGYPFARDRHWIGPEPRATEDRWRHRVVWSPVTVRPRALDGVVLVVPRGLVGDPIVAAVGEALAASERVVVEDDSFAVPRGRVVVSLLGLDEVHGLWWTVRLAQACREARALWSITRGAVAVRPGDPVSPAQAMLWGLGQVLGLEHPGQWGGLVDLPVTAGAAELELLRGVVAATGEEDQVALRGGAAFGRRLVAAGAPRARRWRTSGTALITGGTGGLGGAVARWVSERGAERVVLVSRRGRGAGVDERVQALAAAGTRVAVVACDVADRAALAELLAELDREGPPLRSVFHAAGIEELGGVRELDRAALARALAGKAVGAGHLDELLGERALDGFVLF